MFLTVYVLLISKLVSFNFFFGFKIVNKTFNLKNSLRYLVRSEFKFEYLYWTRYISNITTTI